jgi:hypothetical protein
MRLHFAMSDRYGSSTTSVDFVEKTTGYCVSARTSRIPQEFL